MTRFLVSSVAVVVVVVVVDDDDVGELEEERGKFVGSGNLAKKIPTVDVCVSVSRLACVCMFHRKTIFARTVSASRGTRD